MTEPFTNQHRREHQQALESRIHQLEAQLAAHVNTPMHGMESMDQAAVSPFDWQSPPPLLTVDTTFPTPYSGSEMDLGPFSASSVPSLAITGSEPSPVPSFWSGTTRASSPDMAPTSAPLLPQNLTMGASGHAFSPGYYAQPWNSIDGSSALKPPAPTSSQLSRGSSVSSDAADSDEDELSSSEEYEHIVDVQPLAPAPRLPRQGIFSARTESLPSRFEAETLTTEFVQYIESLEGPKPYTISPAVFGRLCDTVYPDPKSPPPPENSSVSIAMARFHVFLAMAIGMKVRIKDSAEPTNALLDTCYELAMQQASASIFWQEPGGIEAAQLLSMFASIRKEASFEPKSLQHSFSW